MSTSLDLQCIDAGVDIMQGVCVSRSDMGRAATRIAYCCRCRRHVSPAPKCIGLLCVLMRFRQARLVSGWTISLLLLMLQHLFVLICASESRLIAT